ncbi:hypothetical protein [Bradyrhizobium sp.]|uniref:hypothetical protein n=1 Tax=Bradyrhizobium sp. TaxID=376 RepID=UPI0025C24A0C|nr:hypothetical protein [Bradyrhizobium sp.]
MTLNIYETLTFSHPHPLRRKIPTLLNLDLLSKVLAAEERLRRHVVRSNSLRGATMWTRLQIASMLFMMVQAVLFGIGMVAILATPLNQTAMTLIPWMIAISFFVSAPLAWLIAPRLQMRYWRRRGTQGDSISG